MRKKLKIYSFDDYSINEPIVLALGFFDSVHIAHRHLLSISKKIANQNNVKCTVFTFDNNPKKIFKSNQEKIFYDFETRATIFESLNIDYLLCKTFDSDFANLSPETFLDNLARYNIVAIVSGFDYTFGRNASGNVSTLTSFCNKNNIKLFVVDKVSIKETKISTTLITDLLINGNIEEANKLLGAPYSYTGIVVSGHSVGRNLGFATANISINDKLISPKEGVYAGYCLVDGIKYKAMINLGARITFEDYDKKIEAHLLDFEGDIYGQKVTLLFEAYLRKQKHFASPNDLISQLKNDAETTKKILK